jgi:hypothetical protein
MAFTVCAQAPASLISREAAGVAGRRERKGDIAMSGGFVRLIAGLALIAVLVFIGVGVYNAGVTAGLAETGNAVASGAPAVYYPGPYYGHPWGWGGFGFFGIFFWILGIFLIFGLIRAAFGFGRWGRGGRDWSNHHGPGGYGGPRQHFEDWHRQAHEPGGEAKEQ